MHDPTHARCARWLLRMLDHAARDPALKERLESLSGDVTHLAGLPVWKRKDAHRWARICRRLAAQAELPPPSTGPFADILALAHAIGLDPLESELLCVLAAITAVDGLRRLFRDLDPLWAHQRNGLLAAAIGADARAVCRSLSPRGTLRACGLLVADTFRSPVGFDVHDVIMQRVYGGRRGRAARRAVPVGAGADAERR